VDPAAGLRLAYVTLYDPNDRYEWSGLGHAIMQSLRAEGLQVTPLGPLRSRLNPIKRIAERVHAILSRGYYEFQREHIVALDYAWQVSAKLAAGNFDAVFSPGAPIAVSWLACRQPIVIWSGATFASLITHYGFDRINCRASIDAGHRMERSAFARARLLIFASDWAAASAVRDYGVDPAKIKVVPFGANLMTPPTCDEVWRKIVARPTDTCRLIAVGVEWERKGMGRAVELVAALNERGVPAELSIVGCLPPESCRLPPWVRIHGHIDKKRPGGEERLGDLFSASHFHVLFSQAECFGLAFCEANAWGVPNIASDVGGVPSAVVNGQGGWRFVPSMPTTEIADFVARQFRDRVGYLHAARRARDEYDQRLNWRTAGAKVKGYLEAVVKEGSVSARTRRPQRRPA
jgi:glycosyltransferase involved in cell wall biosynthesis